MDNIQLQLRPAQIRALEAALAMDEYETRLVEQLRVAYADAVEGEADDELRGRVRQGIARARAHGFVELETCTQFMMLEFTLGTSLDDADWAVPILADQGGGDARIAALFRAAEPDGASA